MDAISFVLGVRAAHLRGSHLGDLIHNPYFFFQLTTSQKETIH
jgi:chromosome segregation ATPase